MAGCFPLALQLMSSPCMPANRRELFLQLRYHEGYYHGLGIHNMAGCVPLAHAFMLHEGFPLAQVSLPACTFCY